jgi:tetratricopeptide (TPR) repeat protein
VVEIGVIPVARARYHLDLAQQAAAVPLVGPVNEHAAFRSYDAASASDPFDPTSEIARAQWLVGLTGTSPEQRALLQRGAVEALTGAMQRDPFNIQLPRMRSRLYLDLAENTGKEDDYRAAVEDARRALELYPLNPAGIVALADVHAAAGEALGSEKLMREALANYGEAIRLDDRRLPWETFHRLGTKAKDEIRAKIRRVEERLGQP